MQSKVTLIKRCNMCDLSATPSMSSVVLRSVSFTDHSSSAYILIIQSSPALKWADSKLPESTIHRMAVSSEREVKHESKSKNILKNHATFHHSTGYWKHSGIWVYSMWPARCLGLFGRSLMFPSAFERNRDLRLTIWNGISMCSSWYSSRQKHQPPCIKLVMTKCRVTIKIFVELPW